MPELPRQSNGDTTVECVRCHRSWRVDFGEHLSVGWPTHCGETVMITDVDTGAIEAAVEAKLAPIMDAVRPTRSWAMAELPRQSNAGWSNLGGQARKFHYFTSPERGTIALCGKWAIGREHPLEPDNGTPSNDDCAGCRRKLDAGGGRGRCLSFRDQATGAGSPRRASS